MLKELGILATICAGIVVLTKVFIALFGLLFAEALTIATVILIIMAIVIGALIRKYEKTKSGIEEFWFIAGMVTVVVSNLAAVVIVMTLAGVTWGILMILGLMVVWSVVAAYVDRKRLKQEKNK